MIRNSASGCFITLVLPRILILIVLLVVYSASAQELSRFPHKYIEFNMGAQSHFGQYEKQAEISGGYDTLFYDHVKHYRPGFKGSVPFVVTFGQQGSGRFRLVGSLGYFYHETGLVKTTGQEEYHLANIGTVTMNISAQLYLSNHPEKIPYGFYCGFSAGSLYPISISMDKQVETLFGIEEMTPKPEFHLGMEGVWNARLTKSGFYFTMKLATDLPLPLIGSLGKLEMNEDAEYTYNDRGIKMYSIGISGGIGYVIQ